MGRRKSGITNLCLALALLAWLVTASCARPAPAPTPSPAPPKVVAPTITPSPTATPKPPPSPSPAPKPKPKMPDPIVCASNDVGSAGYIMTVAVADAMKKERGLTMRVVPIGTDVGRISFLTTGRGHLLFQGFGLYAAQEAIFGFDTLELGPQPLQLINAGLPTAGMLSCTAKDANIKTWADVKGKRVAYIDGYPAVYIHSDVTLAFAGLTWNDVKKVKFTSYAAMGRGIVEGLVDVATCSTVSAYVYELASSPRGVQWVPYPHADKEAWRRAMAMLPMWVKSFATIGPGLSKEKPLECGTYPNPHVATSPTADPEFAYQMAKLLVELYPVFGKAQAPGIDQFDPERLIMEYAMPYHEGAVRYYKEIGKWTESAQKNNDLMLKRQQVLKDAWEKAIAQAADQKVKADDFPKFWMDVRAKTLEAAGLPYYVK